MTDILTDPFRLPGMPYAKDDGTNKPAPAGTTTPPPAGAGATKPAPTGATDPFGSLLNGRPQWGTAGFLYPQFLTTTNGGMSEDGSIHIPDGMADPRNSPWISGGQFSPAAQAALGDNVQVRFPQVGIPGGVKDPSLVTYDPTFGLITPSSNIIPMNESFMDMWGPWLLAAGGPLLGGAGNAVFGPGEVVGPVAGGVAGEAGGVAGAAGGLVGPPAELAPPPVEGVPPVGAPPPVEGAPPPAGAPPPIAPEIPPPMDPITGATLPPLDPYVPPATVADNLTPGIDNLITPPADPLSVPPPDPGLFPPPSGLPENPDFPINLAPPPDVTVPPPSFNVDTPWYDPLAAGVTKNPLGALSAGVGLYGALTRPKPPAINSNVPDTNKPVIDQAISDIMHHGALSPDQQHLIDGAMDQHIRQGEEAIRQRAINSGMGADSMVTQQQINQFHTDAELVRGQLYQQQMQQNISNAISVWAEGNREDIAIQTAAAQLAQQNNQYIGQLNQSIAQSLAWLYAMSNSRSAPATFPGG